MIQKRKNGFTLIELLVVATIIVVLSAIGLVSFTNAGKSARNSKRKSDLETVRQALVLYKSDTGAYPVALLEGENKVALLPLRDILAKIVDKFKVPAAFAAVEPVGSNDAYNTMISILVAGYISNPTPVDPKSGDTDCGLTGASVCDYTYLGTTTSFTLRAPLEDANDYTLNSP